MAVVQTAENTRGWGATALTDSDGYVYHTFGDIRIYVGTGSPNGIITAPIGSEYTDRAGGDKYVNNDGSTTWEKYSAQ